LCKFAITWSDAPLSSNHVGVVDGVLVTKLTRGSQGEVEFCAVEGSIVED